MNTISIILGEATRRPTESELTHPGWAYLYAKNIIEGPFPEGEEAIATDPLYAYYYAKNFIKGRWPEAEATIAKNPEYSKQYLKEFPEAKMEWFANGWIDWTGL